MQLLGEQFVPSPEKTPPAAAQFRGESTLQAAAAVQHAPIAFGFETMPKTAYVLMVALVAKVPVTPPVPNRDASCVAMPVGVILGLLPRKSRVPTDVAAARTTSQYLVLGCKVKLDAGVTVYVCTPVVVMAGPVRATSWEPKPSLTSLQMLTSGTTVVTAQLSRMSTDVRV